MLFAVIALVAQTLSPLALLAQQQQQPLPPGEPAANALRLEQVPVANGAELLTIWERLGDEDEKRLGTAREIPVVSVLRDTLGDEVPENDILRYVWMHSYTHPNTFAESGSDDTFSLPSRFRQIAIFR
ncbi:MAG: hypothetical protein WKF84_06815 [Pyrinomonadaceae bacterium]